MSDDAPPKKQEGGGAPLWMATFADLMSLLLAFFVLLFSFAKMEDEEFHRRGGKMAEALGVQYEVPANNKVQGVNPVAKEFSSESSKESASLKVVQEFVNQNLRLISLKDDKEGGEGDEGEKAYGKLVKELATQIEEMLSAEVLTGLVDVAYEDGKIIIRMQSELLFKPGSYEPNGEPWNVLVKLHTALAKVIGKIQISGHTGSEESVGKNARAIWELAAARAASIAHYFISHRMLDEKSIELVSYGDSRPLVNRGTPQELAKNRRVEVIISDIDFLQQEVIPEFVPVYLRERKKELKIAFDPKNPGKGLTKYLEEQFPDEEVEVREFQPRPTDDSRFH